MSAPLSTAAAANSRGMIALQHGDFAAAAEAFGQAVAADPSSGSLLRNLASAHRAAGNDAAERVALDAALAIDQRDLVGWMRKSELHQRRGENSAALAAWIAALTLAEPLKPWSGPLAQSLVAGQAFRQSATDTIARALELSDIGDATADDERATRRSGAFVEMALGRRSRFPNQCAGLYYPFLPADEFFDRHHFTWFDELAASTDAIRAELVSLLEDAGDSLRPYVQLDKGSPINLWSSLDGSLDWGACFLWEYGVPNQQVLKRCPATAKAIAAVPTAPIPGRSPNVFFSILRPRAHIPPHTGVTNTRAIVHLPLIVPDGCGFRVGGETRPWVEGEPFAFDDTIEHEAWNDSDQPRAILICDVWNPHLSVAEQAAILRYYDVADSTGFSPLRGN